MVLNPTRDKKLKGMIKMSILKQTKDIYGKGKKKKSINGEKVTETIIIILIIVTSVNLIYWLIPTFLSISFVLLQLRKVVNKYSKR